MRVALTFPPQWTAAHPNTALALLAGELRRGGHFVEIHDLNLELYEHVLSPRGSRIAYERARMERSMAVGEARMRAAVGGDDPAAQALAVLRQLGLPDDADHVNPNGGAIALGHPLGASGGRLMITALNQLEETGGKRALCTMCIGVGQGIALAIERV